MLAFTAGVVSGLIGAFSGGGSGGGGQPAARRRWSPRRWGDFRALPQRIFGYTKREVARVLGPPPAAALGNGAGSPKPTFWQANTWYYPVDPERQRAVAVQFNADRVVRVEILGG